MHGVKQDLKRREVLALRENWLYSIERSQELENTIKRVMSRKIPFKDWLYSIPSRSVTFGANGVHLHLLEARAYVRSFFLHHRS